MKFDFDAIKSIHHHCTGCHSKTDCCCASYDIFISEKEMQRILNIFPQVVEYCPDLMKDGEFDNVFEESDDGLIQLDTDDNGLCVFAYQRQEELVRCALHSVAIDLNLPIEEIKPFHCLLWPMAISSGPESVISIQQNALDFSCNRPQTSDQICKSLEETLQVLFKMNLSSTS
jgi:hypothetical protein